MYEGKDSNIEYACASLWLRLSAIIIFDSVNY